MDMVDVQSRPHQVAGNFDAFKEMQPCFPDRLYRSFCRPKEGFDIVGSVISDKSILAAVNMTP